MTYEMAALMRQAKGAREDCINASVAGMETEDVASDWVNLRDDRPVQRRSSRSKHRNLTTLEKYRKVRSHVCEQPWGLESLQIVFGILFLSGLFSLLIGLLFWVDRIEADRIEACEKAGMNVASPAQPRLFEEKHPVDQLLELQQIKREGQKSLESWIKHEECAIYCAHVTGTEYHVTDSAAWARQEQARQKSTVRGFSEKEGIWTSIRLNPFHTPQDQLDTSQSELPEGCRCSK